MTWWMWYAAGMATVIAVLAIAALASRWLSRQHPTHRAGIDEDEDDPEPEPRTMLTSRWAKPIGRDTASLVDEEPAPLRIDPSLYRYPPPDVGFGDGTPSAEYEPPSMGLGPPPAYPETPAPPRTPERDGAGTGLPGDAPTPG
jgi:hypothetical protein